MQTVEGLDAFAAPPGGVVLTIGNFDGVHRGHQQIIAVGRRWADELSAPLVAMTFEPHPLTILAPQRVPPRLNTAQEKLALLGACGVDLAIVMRSEPALFVQSAEEFLERISQRCRPRVIVEGESFAFGRGRAGSIDTLGTNAGRLGYQVQVAPTVVCAELPGQPVINSSAIRAALLEGRLREARAMLGRPYRIAGIVGEGSGRGGPLGFPTANLEPHRGLLLPKPAVYAAVAQLDGAVYHLAAVNLGPQPTFGQSTIRLEAHLLDFSGDLRGRLLGLHLVHRLRDQVRFVGPAELAEQLRRDVQEVRAFAAELERVRRAPAVEL